MEFQEITLADFIQDVMPSAGHNRNQVLQMAVRQEGDGKDFLYHHVDDHYKITLDSIQAYFVENPRPKKALSAQEENEALRAKVAELEKRLGKEENNIKPTPTGVRVTGVGQAEIPPKDEGIPAKKLSQTDYAKDLAAELKKAKSPSAKAVASAQKKDIPKASK